MVAHACNPSYLGGRDQEDQGSKLAWANSYGDSTQLGAWWHTPVILAPQESK
jgi:hypothetical protein